MGIPLRCDKCGTVKKFRGLEQAKEKGWLLVPQEHGYDTWLCPKCNKEGTEREG